MIMQIFVGFKEILQKNVEDLNKFSAIFRIMIFRNLTDFPLIFDIFPITKDK